MGTTSSHRWPLCPGLQTCYNGRYRGLQTREGEPIPKSRSRIRIGVCNSTPWSRSRWLSLDQQRRGEYVPGPCTHRPVTSRKSVTPEASWPNPWEGAVEGGIGDWDEVMAQGSRTGRCGWITSFLRAFFAALAEGRQEPGPTHRPGRSRISIHWLFGRAARRLA